MTDEWHFSRFIFISFLLSRFPLPTIAPYVTKKSSCSHSKIHRGGIFPSFIPFLRAPRETVCLLNFRWHVIIIPYRRQPDSRFSPIENHVKFNFTFDEKTPDIFSMMLIQRGTLFNYYNFAKLKCQLCITRVKIIQFFGVFTRRRDVWPWFHYLEGSCEVDDVFIVRRMIYFSAKRTRLYQIAEEVLIFMGFESGKHYVKKIRLG